MIWKCCEKEIEYGKKTLIMGIVNITPDSFSDGGDNFSPERAVETALQMERDGADIIDLGAQSTRPGHTLISPEEEWKRMEPVLEGLKGKISVPLSADTFYPAVVELISPEEEWKRMEPVLEGLKGKISVPLSADTFYPAVVEKAIKNGVSIVNDVSGIISPEMAETVKKTGAGWIIMHNGAGDIEEVKNFFEKSAEQIEKIGINKNQICFDMGIGFGKTRPQDMSLIANAQKYKLSGYPLLLGTSRKRVIKEGSKQENPKERIYGNIAADTAAILGGADIIRLHDVKNEKQGVYMADALKGAQKN